MATTSKPKRAAASKSAPSAESDKQDSAAASVDESTDGAAVDLQQPSPDPQAEAERQAQTPTADADVIVPSTPAQPVASDDGKGDSDTGDNGTQDAGTVTGDDSDEPLPAIYVRAARGIESRRRAGLRFDRQGRVIATSALNDTQIAALEADSALIVEHCTVPAKDGGNE
ncbi:hypothetical protein QO259_10405 [Salinicola sp. JS01]|uniref:hypothetical protein n=1 Tax=Salinicola sp. JS01 TaxID=3050071 RepID=UPI00255B5812|nr:hypothetical protein [Salinicola sp. JS01]WIX31246.1 hypothetical protein QO259_10405 [Salinicola sp. JS01]